jgi:hypothetical protein
MGIIGTESPVSPIDHTTWELHHFFIQHGKIIKPVDATKKMTPVSFLKIMQIAYNAGQLNAEMFIKKNPIYEIEWKAYYASNMLDQITSYVDPHTMVNDQINDKLKKTIEQLILNMTMTKPNIDDTAPATTATATTATATSARAGAGEGTDVKTGGYSKVRIVKFRIQPNFI